MGGWKEDGENGLLNMYLAPDISWHAALTTVLLVYLLTICQKYLLPYSRSVRNWSLRNTKHSSPRSFNAIIKTRRLYSFYFCPSIPDLSPAPVCIKREAGWKNGQAIVLAISHSFNHPRQILSIETLSPLHVSATALFSLPHVLYVPVHCTFTRRRPAMFAYSNRWYKSRWIIILVGYRDGVKGRSDILWLQPFSRPSFFATFAPFFVTDICHLLSLCLSRGSKQEKSSTIPPRYSKSNSLPAPHLILTFLQHRYTHTSPVWKKSYAVYIPTLATALLLVTQAAALIDQSRRNLNWDEAPPQEIHSGGDLVWTKRWETKVACLWRPLLGLRATCLTWMRGEKRVATTVPTLLLVSSVFLFAGDSCIRMNWRRKKEGKKEWKKEQEKERVHTDCECLPFLVLVHENHMEKQTSMSLCH